MTNGGLLTTRLQGYLNNYGNVWYHPKSISKVLSLINLKNNNHIIYDSNNGD